MIPAHGARTESRARPDPRTGALAADLGGVRYTLRIDAIPDAMSTAVARELVGQPNLRNHDHADQLTDNAPGIGHLIACHRGVTRTQPTRLIGTTGTTRLDQWPLSSELEGIRSDPPQRGRSSRS